MFQGVLTPLLTDTAASATIKQLMDACERVEEDSVSRRALAVEAHLVGLSLALAGLDDESAAFQKSALSLGLVVLGHGDGKINPAQQASHAFKKLRAGDLREIINRAGFFQQREAAESRRIDSIILASPMQNLRNPGFEIVRDQFFFNLPIYYEGMAWRTAPFGFSVLDGDVFLHARSDLWFVGALDAFHRVTRGDRSPLALVSAYQRMLQFIVELDSWRSFGFENGNKNLFRVLYEVHSNDPVEEHRARDAKTPQMLSIALQAGKIVFHQELGDLAIYVQNPARDVFGLHLNLHDQSPHYSINPQAVLFKHGFEGWRGEEDRWIVLEPAVIAQMLGLS